MKIQSLILSVLSLLSLSAGACEQVRDQLDAPQQVYVDNSGEFHLIKDGQQHAVNRVWVDPLLKQIKTQKQADAFNKACYVRSVQMSDNNYKLIALGHLRGGGGVGAVGGFWLGKGAVYLLGHGTIAAVTVVTAFVATPVAAAAAATWMEAVASGPIEAASNVAGLGMGIVCGTITGPI